MFYRQYNIENKHIIYINELNLKIRYNIYVMLQQYRISITDTDRSYNSCKLYEHNSTNNQEIPNTLIPLAYELFNNDIIEFDKKKDELVKTIHSPTRTAIMPGVLILEHNNTFGRTENKKRLLYKCFPADKHLPVFLIPYDIKLDFHKQLINKYTGGHRIKTSNMEDID